MILLQDFKKFNIYPNDITFIYNKEKSPNKLNMIDVYNHKIIPVDVLLYNGLKCKKEITRKRPNYYIIEKDLNIVAS